MARSPSRSSDGASSTHHVRAEPRLLKAIEEKNNEAAIAIIEDAKAHSKPIEHLLRIGLMRASERGNIAIAEYLLKNGAKANGAPGGRVSPLLRAVEKNDVGIVRVLLRYGGDVDVCDKQGRTALMTAAWKNHFHILNELLKHGADVNKKDNKGRNVLHNLAADNHCDWGSSVIELLLRTNIVIDGKDGQDETKRTPLHWAASTGKKELCEMLLVRQKGPRANINAVEAKEKTALHLAVAHGRDDIVELLIHYGANIKARSDGKWTALHNACQQGSVKIVRLLLGAGAEINARLLNGMTPLHIAAQNDHLHIVECLLERDDCKRTARDAFGITPFILAAKQKNRDIVHKLAPFNQVETLSRDALGACTGFQGTIVDFGNFRKENRVTKRSVFEILYAKDPVNPRKPAFSVLPKQEKAVDFRWIHLPANNMAWVEALLTKVFVEEGAHDVDAYIALERSFSHQHRGQQIHSHFMRPLCQSTPRTPKHMDDSDLSDVDHGPPAIVVSQGSGLGIDIGSGSGAEQHSLPSIPRAPVRTGTVSTDQTDWTVGTAGSGSGKEHKLHGKSKEKHKKTPKWSGSRQAGGRSGGTETPPRRTDHQQRRQSSTPLSGSLLRTPNSPGRKDASAQANMFTFMPYLHFETDANRQEMQKAIEEAQKLKEREKHDGVAVRPVLKKAETYDEMLLRAHLVSSTVSLHVRRTLDQFFYHNIDTKSRDEDQVVYRYQTQRMKRMASEESGTDPKVFMVDQLWMWVLGKDLVVTAFPQRWQQPRNDPLNVLDGIIEQINSNTREELKSVYDLAMIITSRCSGIFDRHRMGDEDYQFIDMFESSIGEATEKETLLFQNFNLASKKASVWLKHHSRSNRFTRHLQAESRHIEHANKRGTHSHSHSHRHPLEEPPVPEVYFQEDDMGPGHTPFFVDELLDIGAETDLLTETKDIRDEIAMITKVLEDQRTVLEAMRPCITDIFQKEHRRQQDLKRRFEEQSTLLKNHVSDLERMDKQASRIYESITDLLDLKQKHANALEARFARDQAADTARQSQTVMVFTIVTIIFLPLSFMAAIFTINVREFPHLPGGDQPSLPLSYVSKYIVGIGFAISIPLIFIALSYERIGTFIREMRLRWKERKRARTLSSHHEIRDEKFDYEGGFAVDIHALEQALSTRGRPSVESYVNGGGSLTLLPVTSRGTAASPNKREIVVSNPVYGVNGGAARRGSSATARRPNFQERTSTGFRIRQSLDVERVL